MCSFLGCGCAEDAGGGTYKRSTRPARNDEGGDYREQQDEGKDNESDRESEEGRRRTAERDARPRVRSPRNAEKGRDDDEYDDEDFD